jgi:ABC-type uncharacterized transport system ATPase subunit
MRVLFLGGTGNLSSACSRLAVERGLTLTVLTRGRVLAEGNYETVSNNPEVREAYMGVGHA